MLHVQYSMFISCSRNLITYNIQRKILCATSIPIQHRFNISMIIKWHDNIDIFNNNAELQSNCVNSIRSILYAYANITVTFTIIIIVILFFVYFLGIGIIFYVETFGTTLNMRTGNYDSDLILFLCMFNEEFGFGCLFLCFFLISLPKIKFQKLGIQSEWNWKISQSISIPNDNEKKIIWFLN